MSRMRRSLSKQDLISASPSQKDDSLLSLGISELAIPVHVLFHKISASIRSMESLSIYLEKCSEIYKTSGLEIQKLSLKEAQNNLGVVFQNKSQQTVGLVDKILSISESQISIADLIRKEFVEPVTEFCKHAKPQLKTLNSLVSRLDSIFREKESIVKRRYNDCMNAWAQCSFGKGVNQQSLNKRIRRARKLFRKHRLLINEINESHSMRYYREELLTLREKLEIFEMRRSFFFYPLFKKLISRWTILNIGPVKELDEFHRYTKSLDPMDALRELILKELDTYGTLDDEKNESSPALTGLFNSSLPDIDFLAEKVSKMSLRSSDSCNAALGGSYGMGSLPLLSIPKVESDPYVENELFDRKSDEILEPSSSYKNIKAPRIMQVIQDYSGSDENILTVKKNEKYLILDAPHDNPPPSASIKWVYGRKIGVYLGVPGWLSLPSLSNYIIDENIDLECFLQIPSGLEEYRVFLISEQGQESVEFLRDALIFRGQRDSENLKLSSLRIFYDYIADSAAHPINISADTVINLNAQMQGEKCSHTMFDSCIKEIFGMLKRDSFLRYKKSDAFYKFMQNVTFD